MLPHHQMYTLVFLNNDVSLGLQPSVMPFHFPSTINITLDISSIIDLSIFQQLGHIAPYYHQSISSTFLISLNGSYISTPSLFSPTSSTCTSIHSVPLRITHPSSFGVFPNLKLAEPKCRIVPPFLWRIFKLSDAVWRYATCQLLQRLPLIYTSQNVYMSCLLLLSNEPIHHTYVYYFNHHILQSITLILGNPVWYIQQRLICFTRGNNMARPTTSRHSVFVCFQCTSANSPFEKISAISSFVLDCRD